MNNRPRMKGKGCPRARPIPRAILLVEEGYYDADEDWVPAVYEVGSFRPVIGLGGGIGTEIILFRHFSIPLEVGYSVNWSPLAGELSEQFDINLRPQIGGRYRY